MTKKGSISKVSGVIAPATKGTRLNRGREETDLAKTTRRQVGKPINTSRSVKR